MPNDKGLGEQALSQAAEAGFSSQLDDVEELDVDIQTNPLKAVQGKADSVSMKGKKWCRETLFSTVRGKIYHRKSLEPYAIRLAAYRYNSILALSLRFVVSTKRASRAEALTTNASVNDIRETIKLAIVNSSLLMVLLNILFLECDQIFVENTPVTPDY